jgi:competence protein ComEC
LAGLHVGALAFALYWAGRGLRLPRMWTMLFTITLLSAYVAVVVQRAPVLRAAVMAAIVVFGGFFFRRLELLNSAAVAALILLAARPLALRDSSFQLTFVAIGCIAGLALPWLEKTVQPYVRSLQGWRDVTRDAAHEPRAIQFRIDLRSLAQWLSTGLPQRLGKPAGDILVGGLSLTFRVWELLVITIALQAGMLPLMARDFHRIPLSAPIVNLAAVPLTGVIVPLGFLTFGLRANSPSDWKIPCGSTCLADCTAFARCPVVRAFSEMELPDSRAAILADRFVFCRRHSASGSDAVEAFVPKSGSLGTTRRIHRLRADDCNLSFWRKVDKGQAGIDSP